MGDILIARTVYGYYDSFELGDRIKIGGNYTATCQKIKKNGEAIFLFDQVFPRAATHDLAVDYANLYQQGLFYAPVRDMIVPFKNGNILRLPYVEEIFGEHNFVEPSGKKQWELMKTVKNRIAVDMDSNLRRYWLANKNNDDTECFAIAYFYGPATCTDASYSHIYVRPVFKLRSIT